MSHHTQYSLFQNLHLPVKVFAFNFQPFYVSLCFLQLLFQTLSLVIFPARKTSSDQLSPDSCFSIYMHPAIVRKLFQEYDKCGVGRRRRLSETEATRYCSPRVQRPENLAGSQVGPYEPCETSLLYAPKRSAGLNPALVGFDDESA